MPKAPVSDKALDLTSLAYAVLVSDERKFSSGGSRCWASAPQLSVAASVPWRIRLACSLFHRTRRGVQATTAGLRVLKRARSILSDVRALRRTALQNSTGAEGRLRLGGRRLGSLRVLPASVGIFRPRSSGARARGGGGLVRREYRGRSGAHARFRLRSSGVPLSPGCELEELWRERVMVALPDHHHLSTAKLIFWEQLENERFIVSRVDPGPEIQDYIHPRPSGPREATPTWTSSLSTRETLLALVGLAQGLSLVGEAEAGVTYPGVTFRASGPRGDSVQPGPGPNRTTTIRDSGAF